MCDRLVLAISLAPLNLRRARAAQALIWQIQNALCFFRVLVVSERELVLVRGSTRFFRSTHFANCEFSLFFGRNRNFGNFLKFLIFQMFNNCYSIYLNIFEFLNFFFCFLHTGEMFRSSSLRWQPQRMARGRASSLPIALANYSNNSSSASTNATATAFAQLTSPKTSEKTTFADSLHALQCAILSPSHGALQSIAPAVVKQYWSNSAVATAPVHDDPVHVLHCAVATGCVDVVNKLVGIVDVDAVRNGTTALAVSVQRGDDKMIRALLAAGASVAKSALLGVPMLHFAAARNAASIVDLLVQFGAVDINEAGPERWTAIHAAASRGCLDALRALLSHRAAVDLVAAGDARPIDLAAAGGHTSVVRMLISAGATVSANTVTRAVTSGSEECVAALLVSGGSPIAVDSDAKSPLSVAIENNRFDIATLLVARGAHFGPAEQLKLTRLADGNEWLALPHRHAELEVAYRTIARARRLLNRHATM
jgi:ankyrin repeat protein